MSARSTNKEGAEESSSVSNSSRAVAAAALPQTKQAHLIKMMVALLSLAVLLIVKSEQGKLKRSLPSSSASDHATSTSTVATNVRDDNNNNNNDMKIKPCAPFLQAEQQRKVLLLGGVSNWNGFYFGTRLVYSSKSSKAKKQQQKYFFQRNFKKENYHFSHGGENYVFATLDWSLQQLGFVVEVSTDNIDDFTPDELRQYHRIFKNGLQWPLHLDDHPDILCKIRNLHFWGNWMPTEEEPWDPRQVLSPYPEGYNTFIGYFIHNLVEIEPIAPTVLGQQQQQQQQQKLLRSSANNNNNKKRNKKKTSSGQQQHNDKKKQGFLLGKMPELFSQHLGVIQALLDDGFTLHTTCKGDDDDPTCGLPLTSSSPPKKHASGGGIVVRHGVLAPNDYDTLMSQMDFVIGFGNPGVSPSPLVGMSHGAAWLNPLMEPLPTPTLPNPPTKQQMLDALHTYPLRWHHPNIIQAQHTPLALLGMPYVYNIDLDNITSVLVAANWATKYRFDSFVPSDYTPHAMMARTCSIMTDDAICQCPSGSQRTFGKRKQQQIIYNNDSNRSTAAAAAGQQQSSEEEDHHPVDCHGNSYVQNWGMLG